MQMKMDKIRVHRFDKLAVRKLLEAEDDFITELLDSCEVPDAIEDETADDQYLLKTEESNGMLKHRKNVVDRKPRAQSGEELQQRLEIMQNKIKSKKSKPSDRTLKKKQQKKLKKSAELKKQLISVAKSIKNEQIKERKGVNSNSRTTNGTSSHYENGENVDEKPDIKPDVKPEKTFNEHGKIVFSKFEFAARPSQAKKSKKDKSVKNPKIILKQIKDEKKEINELLEHGEVEKAEEIKKDIAWKKAFDKSDGKKVKDNTALLHKAIHKRAVEKKKSKLEWKEREQKKEKDIENRQKKREANLAKKSEGKKKNKLKNATKRGRVIPGY